MNKTAQRLLVFFIGIPVVISFVFIDFANHLALQCAVLATSVLSSIELHKMLKSKTEMQPLPFVTCITVLIPLFSFIYVFFDLPYYSLALVTVCSAFISLLYEIFAYDRETLSFEKATTRISSSFLILFYCGYLPSFVTRMTAWENSTAYISSFLLMVFCCDSIAWFFGILMGKGNRGFLKASPNKSIIGFIGGFVGSAAAATASSMLFKCISIENLKKMLFISFFLSLTSIFGDLIESVFKRSTNFKDSGNIIPGRGGLLDSVDSILFSAPIYYLLVSLIFGL